jgi:hypothetical protein
MDRAAMEAFRRPCRHHHMTCSYPFLPGRHGLKIQQPLYCTRCYSLLSITGSKLVVSLRWSCHFVYISEVAHAKKLSASTAPPVRPLNLLDLEALLKPPRYCPHYGQSTEKPTFSILLPCLGLAIDESFLETIRSHAYPRRSYSCPQCADIH